MSVSLIWASNGKGWLERFVVGNFFHGFGIQGYRSFREEMQFVGPLKRINLLAGQNNSGKSNIVRFLIHHLSGQKAWIPSGLDAPRGAATEIPFACALPLPPTDQIVEPFQRLGPSERRDLEAFLSCRALRLVEGSDRAWVKFSSSGAGPQARNLVETQAEKVLEEVGDRAARSLSSAMTGSYGGQRLADCLRVLNALASQIEVPKVHLIDSFRQIRELRAGESADNYAGFGLIDQVALLQNPEALQQLEHERKYALLNQFVAEVFEEKTARLEVPASRKTINVRMRGSLLPLENQGTGMHQVIIIATAATMIEHSLVCIEEPEINLHPILQKRLLNFLLEHTSNQYLITTHSAQMLDYERANVFHLEHSPSGTAVSAATTPAQVSAICVDLGYRPSDLLQSNAVIWVEGPSDRIYIRDWIRRLDEGLVEGIHYSIMFYGGSLLRDLDVDDDKLSEFISLRRLNRHLIVVMDSDRRRRGAKLAPAKLRILERFAESEEPGFGWLTDGYTIENYVPVDVLTKAVSVVHPRSSYSWNGERWSNPLGSLASPNKVRIAEKAVSIWPDPMSDRRLLKWMKQVVALIRQANGIS